MCGDTKSNKSVPCIDNGLTKDEKISKITDLFGGIMETLGLDLTDDSLKDTPKRVAKMYVTELFSGLDKSNFPSISSFENNFGYDQMLVERDIKVHSVCEHHFVPIIGKAHVAYIPKDRVVGLSKLNRIVDFYCRMPQVQERLTELIHDKLCEVLQTEDVAVVIDAYHYCVSMRGVKDVGSSTVTCKLGGSFASNPTTKQEFLSYVNAK